MKPDAKGTDPMTRLRVTVCAAEALVGTNARRAEILAFLDREGGTLTVRGERREVYLLGLTSRSKASLTDAFARWIASANRKLARADAPEEITP